MTTIWRNEDGFTLTELLVAFTVSALIFGSVIAIEQAASTAYVTGSNRIEVMQSVRGAVDRMAREIRESRVAISVGNANLITFTDSTGVVVTYDLNAGNLRRNGVVVVGRVTALTFGYMDGSNSSLATPVGSPANIRRIDITVQGASEDVAALGGAAANTRAQMTTTVRLRNL